ncbi:MAG: nucleotidyltransferase family protein [Desulfomonilaceae bacterium]
MNRPKISIPQNKIVEFCARWEITELALFGSALRDDFGSDSDIDILVTFAPEARRTLFDMVDMKDELEAIFGRKVDVVSRRGVESSRNPLRRKAVLDSAEVIYAAS